MCALSYQTLCSPMDCSPQGSSVYDIFWARILEQVAISHSRVSSQASDWTPISCISYIVWQAGSLPLAPPRKPEVKMLVAQSCPALCNLMDCSLLCSSVRGILQARILEWVALTFSRVSSQLRDQMGSPALQVDSFTIWATWEAPSHFRLHQNYLIDLLK